MATKKKRASRSAIREFLEKGGATREKVRALREESERKYEEEMQKSHQRTNEIIETMMSSLNELNIPESLTPPNKEWKWVRYAAMDADGEYTDIEVYHLDQALSGGWRPVWAFRYPELHTEAKKAYSRLFLIYKDVILCERNKPAEPEPIKPKLKWFRKAFNWLKEKLFSDRDSV